MKKINYYTNIAPHYRERLWKLLAKQEEFDIYFFFGKSIGIKEIKFDEQEWENFREKIHHIDNFRIQKVLVWQRGVITSSLRSSNDVAIFLGDMFIISNWIAAIIMKLSQNKVIFWGHGLYGDESFLKKSMRKLFLKLADDHLLYSRRAKKLMKEEGFDEENLHVVYNSLDYQNHLDLRKRTIIPQYYESKNYFEDENLPVLIFIGRLTSKKKLDLLIRAVQRINSPEDKVNLVIIGDGPERERVVKLASSIRSSVYFWGACYDEEIIGEHLANAELCVSPGNVGLTAIHSLSFGTPVCTHGNMAKQMPEAEAVKQGKTGCFFRKDDVKDLTEKIEGWVFSNNQREEIRENCYAIVDRYYNPQYQIKVFKEVLAK